MKKRHFNSLIVALALLLFAAVTYFVADSTSSMMEEEARRTVDSVVSETVGRINRMMSDVETAVANSIWIIQEHLKDPDYMYRITGQLVTNNRYIIGSTVAFEPDFYPEKGRIYSPYTCEDGKDGLRNFSLAYDIYEADWYRVPRRERKPSWCEPYFDKGGGEVMMCTYSHPVLDASGKVVAIVTADVSLADLTAYVSSLRPFKDSYATLFSRAGHPLVAPPDNVGIREEVRMSGYAENGWKVELSTPVTNIISGARAIVKKIIVFSLIGILMLCSVAWFFSRRLRIQEALAARIRGELSVSNRIQMSRLVRDFPGYIHATLKPAKEVGGDFYDFVERDGRLYFAVGDVSGKGVPAALYTFLAGAAFRMACSADSSAAEIATRLNSLLASGNDECMFMTMCIGVLDRTTGRLDFCNAGHNPPIMVSPDGKSSYIRIRTGIVIGACDDTRYGSEEMTLERGSRLIVYTDGITEAENAAHEFFGEDRLKALAERDSGLAPNEFIAALIGEVRRYSAGCEQSDDQTLLVIDMEKGKATANG